jgi:hypothetical protein
MTSEQRQLAGYLVLSPHYPQGRISKEEFATRFPGALRDGRLSLDLLDAACRDENAEDLEHALTVGFVFGFSPQHEKTLCSLVSEFWHRRHEDVVSALVDIGATDQMTADAFYAATLIASPYLIYDGSTSLAVKAIWGLGRMPGTYPEEKLKTIAQSANPVLRENAENQLKRRNA